MKKKLAPAIKAVAKKYGMKVTIGVDNHSSLVVRVKEGALAFDAYEQVNVITLKSSTVLRSDCFLRRDACCYEGEGWYCNDDLLTL